MTLDCAEYFTNELVFLLVYSTDSFKPAATRRSSTSSFHTMDVAAKSHVQFVHRLITFWLFNQMRQSPRAGTQLVESPAVRVRSPKKRFTSSLSLVCMINKKHLTVVDCEFINIFRFSLYSRHA